MIFSGDTFEHKGYTFKLELSQDDYHSEPWKEYDGHGPVSDWTTRDKKPGERVLHSDRHSKRYYDYAEAIRIAKRDGWGCEHSTHDGTTFISGHATIGEAAACAVEQDYEFLRSWCADEWHYCVVGVTLLDEDEEETDEVEYLSGVEDRDYNYIETIARELADEILGHVEVDEPDIVLSVN